MKTRVISAAVALVLLAAAMYFYRTVAFEILIAAISAIGVYEMFSAKGMNKTVKGITVTGIIFAVAIVFKVYDEFNKYFPIVAIAAVIVMFALQLKNFDKIKFELIAYGMAVSVLIPLSLSSLAFIKKDFTDYASGLFYILLAFAGAWVPDTGAFFAGRAFGKHKLCPNISPKKTKEGAVGGFVASVIFFLLYGFVFTEIAGASGITMQVNYLYLAILALILTPLSIMGDLCASVVKRQCGIKDYGNIMPGHGGVMDRFDSVLFVAPATYIFISFLPIVTII